MTYIKFDGVYYDPTKIIRIEPTGDANRTGVVFESYTSAAMYRVVVRASIADVVSAVQLAREM